MLHFSSFLKVTSFFSHEICCLSDSLYDKCVNQYLSIFFIAYALVTACIMNITGSTIPR